MAGGGPSLEGLAVGVDHLDAIVVFAYGREAPYSSWVRRGADVDERDVASKADRLFAIVRDADTLMVESKRSFVMVHGVRSFGVAIVFAREVPLGFARMASRQIASTLAHELPFEAPAAEPRNVETRNVETRNVETQVTPHAPTAQVEPPVPPPAVVPPARVESVPPTVDASSLESAQDGAAAELTPPALVVPAVVEQTDPNTVLPAVPAMVTTGAASSSSSSTSTPSVAARPTVPSTPPAPPQVDFDADNGPDTKPPRSAVGNRVRAILAHVEKAAPDGHIARLRVALRSGLGLEALVYPDDLSSEALVVIETAAEDILGIDHGQLGELASP